MDFKSVLKKKVEKAVIKKATGNLIPMEGPEPKIGKKVKLAALLGTIATIAAMASQYFGG